MKQAFWILLFLLSGTTGAAEDVFRLKTHAILSNGDEPVAEYTDISTTAKAGGHSIWRILFEDHAGQRLVIRGEVHTERQHLVVSIQDVRTNEVLRLTSVYGTGLLSFGSESVSFDDVPEGDIPPEVRQDARKLVSRTSDRFQAALRHLAAVGAETELDSVAYVLKALVFPDVRSIPVTEDGEPLVIGFDPYAVDPGEFETAFGSAWYE